RASDVRSAGAAKAGGQSTIPRAGGRADRSGPQSDFSSPRLTAPFRSSMFTGIIQAIGAVRAITPKDGGVQLTIEAGTLDLKNTAIGDSICVSGCCLTATHIDGSSFTADVSRATLEVTTLGR